MYVAQNAFYLFTLSIVLIGLFSCGLGFSNFSTFVSSFESSFVRFLEFLELFEK